MTKYSVPDDAWDDDEPTGPPAWKTDTSARDIQLDVQLHDEGYQTDRKWTIHCTERAHDDRLLAAYGVEHRNKGNFWRDGDRWDDAVDFVDLPLRVRKRVATVLNRGLDTITPDERVISREDGTGVADREVNRGETDE